MNPKSFLGLALLLCVTGCSSAVSDQAPSQSPVSSVSSPLPTASAQPLKPSISPSVKPSTSSASPIQTAPPRVSSAQPVPGKRIDPPANSGPLTVKPNPEPEMERDYGVTTPIATTGKVTVRDRIRFLDSDKLLTACPTDTAPYALAESTHYRVQICSGEYDPQLPKYYIGQAKDGGSELRITSSDLNEARQLTFKNGDYTYILYRDGAKPDQSNAYLEVHMPNGKSYAEALFYLYE
ncbi:MAG: hypothetical protein KME15_13475 [Drouetiella hepatica Uher 2000/2452]|uniref:Lipoprotein n=1 Tax=Drouetiella hepatica Uher 2000/2452 TaxID=904376 RepID=A0A951QBH4_9CYAN|nr:hypothetical protein [Drouetiella hepatica Uher 2000/2452]